MALFERKKIRGRGKNDVEASTARRFLRIALQLVGGALFLLAVWYGTRLDFLTVQEITIEGGETISHEMVENRVRDELTGTYFFIIPKRFTYVYPHDAILAAIEKIPGAHSIVVSKVNTRALHILFDEYIPHALWCAYGDVSGTCYFINDVGFAFAPAPNLTGGTFVRHSVENLGELKVGPVFEVGTLTAIDHFITLVYDELKFRINSVEHKGNGDILFHSNGGGTIIASGKKDFDVTFKNLKSVLRSPEFKHLAPGNFNYIDVRFDNKVFVNEELFVGTTTDPLPDLTNTP